MAAAANWPRHFFLIARGDASRHHKPSPENMGSKAYNLLRMTQIVEEKP